MSLFEFISGMISVLIALAIAQLLVSLGRLAQHRSQVRAYLPHTLWNIAIFLLAFIHWWSLWDFRDLAWNSAMFLYSLMGPLSLFFAVTVLSPVPAGNDTTVDLKRHFQEVRVMFLWAMIVTLGFMSLDGPMFGTEDWFNVLRLIQVLVIAATGVALVSKRDGVQLASSGFVVLTFFYAAVVRFLPGAITG